MRLVTVAYRLERLRGSALAQVRASADVAACGPLDACGLHGTIGVTTGPARGGQIYLTADGPARRPYRDFLTALGLSVRGDRAGIDVGGAGEQRLHGSVSADLHQAGACRDTTTLFSAQFSLQTHAGRLHVALAPLVSQASDGLRTRCPGPAISQHDLASATVPLSTLRRPTFTVALHRATFQDRAYRVRTTSTLVLTLRRTRVTTQTYALPGSNLATR